MRAILETMLFGVRKLYAALLSTIAVAGLVTVVALIVTFPLWWVSSRAPGLFSAAVVGSAVVAIAAFVVARVRGSIRTSPGSATVWTVAVKPVLLFFLRAAAVSAAVYLTAGSISAGKTPAALLGGAVTVVLLSFLLGRHTRE